MLLFTLSVSMYFCIISISEGHLLPEDLLTDENEQLNRDKQRHNIESFLNSFAFSRDDKAVDDIDLAIEPSSPTSTKKNDSIKQLYGQSTFSSINVQSSEVAHSTSRKVSSLVSSYEATSSMPLLTTSILSSTPMLSKVASQSISIAPSSIIVEASSSFLLSSSLNESQVLHSSNTNNISKSNTLPVTLTVSSTVLKSEEMTKTLTADIPSLTNFTSTTFTLPLPSVHTSVSNIFSRVSQIMTTTEVFLPILSSSSNTKTLPTSASTSTTVVLPSKSHLSIPTTTREPHQTSAQKQVLSKGGGLEKLMHVLHIKNIEVTSNLDNVDTVQKVSASPSVSKKRMHFIYINVLLPLASGLLGALFIILLIMLYKCCRRRRLRTVKYFGGKPNVDFMKLAQEMNLLPDSDSDLD